MLEFSVSAVAVLSLVAAVQSLVFDYFPPVASWFEDLLEYKKRQLTLALGALFGVLAFVGQCRGFFVTDLVCEPQSIITLLGNIAVSVSVGYSFHKQTKPTEAFKDKLGIE